MDIEILSYDYYDHMVPNDKRYNEKYTYYEMLREYCTAAKKHKRPFWVSQASVVVQGTDRVLEKDFRWQLNTALAHGAKGVQWFFLKDWGRR